jgi:glucose/mannose transport system permease protein
MPPVRAGGPVVLSHLETGDDHHQHSGLQRPIRLFRNKAAKIAAIPMILTALVVFMGGTIWTIVFSFTKSRLLPRADFVGLDQYERLWSSSKWMIAIENLIIFGLCSLVFSLVIGFVLAALLDQKIRFENTFRTIMLYPFALSFIVTGLVWQWILNPDFGIQHVIRAAGWESFSFDPLNNQDDRHLWHSHCRTLAGHRSDHVPDARRPARY